ncbi:MAG: ABC transporter permease, partial [Chloroflexota bacterium]
MNDNNQANVGFLNRLTFYFTYSARNIRRGRRWIALAIFCIAAGVATVVALRGLGLSIAESLITSVRDDNKGDILINRATDNAPDFALSLGSQEVEFFNANELQAFRQFATDNNLGITEFSSGGAVQIAAQSGGSVLTSQFAVTYLIDPMTYPVVGEIRVVEPAGATFQDLFTGGLDIVISENLAQSQNIGLGDEVRIARTEEVFIVSGIVGVEAEAGISNPFGAFFGFAYLELATAQRVIDSGIGVNRISYGYPEALTYEQGEIEEDRIQDLDAFRRRTTFISTAGEVLDDREEIATVLGDFIVV